MEITIGNFTLPALLTVVLALVYHVVPGTPARAKPLIAVGCGTALGAVGMIYAGADMTAKVVIEYLLAGFMAGAAAVGLYEFQAKARNTKAKTGQTRQKPTKLYNIGIILVALAVLAGGCFGALGAKPWGERTAIEKSVFFMDFYKGQYNDTMTLAKQPELTESQKKIVNQKKQLLFTFKLLARSYDDYAKGGLTVPADLEQKLLELVNKLATMQ